MLCWTISRVRVRGIQAGGGRSAVRCCGLFSCLYTWRGSAGDWPPVAVPCPASRCARLRDLKRYARLPCRCAAAALSGLRRCGGSAGARPLRRGRGCPAGSPGPAPRRALLPAPLPRGGCAAAWPVAALPPGGRLVGVPPPRVLARCGAGVAAAAGKEKAGLAAGFPGKRKIRTPFSCR